MTVKTILILAGVLGLIPAFIASLMMVAHGSEYSKDDRMEYHARMALGWLRLRQRIVLGQFMLIVLGLLL